MRIVTGPWGSFRCWDQDIVGSIIATGQFWDQQIQPFLDEADPSGWALDLGANIGWFTVYLARRFAHVFAVEAHPGTVELLRENVTAHMLADKVTILQAAAYDRVTELHLATAEQLGWPVPSETDLDRTHGAASIAFVPMGTGLAVSALPIDPLLREARVVPFVHEPRVTMIKSDCQGADLRALIGLQRTIARDRPLIVFEFEGPAALWHGDTWDDYLAFFAARNYSVTQIRPDLGDYVARPLEVTP